MNRPRFIACVPHRTSSCDEAERHFRDVLARQTDLQPVHETAGLLLAAPHGHVQRLGHSGLIIGSLYTKGGDRSPDAGSATENSPIGESGPARLVRHFWGPYVAFFETCGDPTIRVLRAPLGELPVYIHKTADTHFLASDPILLHTVTGLAPRPDWGRLARHLARCDRLTEETCLADIDELRGGCVLEATGATHRIYPVWTPRACAQEPPIEHRAQAIDELRHVVRTSLAARCEPHEKHLVMLSGGLDSSIVAAALQATGAQVAALTLVTRDAIGDERPYARAVAKGLGIALHEHFRDVDKIDVTHCLSAAQARPGGRMIWQETARHAEILAKDAGIAKIWNGGGGDQAFCSLLSANPVADRLLRHGPGPGAWRLARDMSALTQVATRTVLCDAAKRAWLGKRSPSQPRDLSLLGGAATAAAGPGALPNTTASQDLLGPGQSAHCRLIAAAQSYVEALDPRPHLPTCAPLLAQPIVETCLHIPSWLWFDAGHDRAIARHAFVGSLPDAVVWRRSKGTPDPFTAEIYETHREALRAHLADGLLASHGVIDRPQVLSALEARLADRTGAFRRILQLADAESWARAWYR